MSVRGADAHTETAAAAAACRAHLAASHGLAGEAAAALDRVFADTRAAYWGEWPSHRPCDTPYHDLRHALVTAELAARLVARHTARYPDAALDAPHAALTVVLALLHDTGFLRHQDEPDRPGAELAPIHEARSVAFVRAYLPHTPWAHLAARADALLATRLDTSTDDLPSAGAIDQLMFHIVGTADLLAQIADPDYLPRCRDYLYREFVAAGLDRGRDAQGHLVVRYTDATDLLRQTDGFVRHLALPRLEANFAGLWRVLDPGDVQGRSAQQGIAHNLARLAGAIAADDWSSLPASPAPLLPPVAPPC